MGVLLQICCILSEYLFLRTPLDAWFCLLIEKPYNLTPSELLSRESQFCWENISEQQAYNLVYLELCQTSIMTECFLFPQKSSITLFGKVWNTFLFSLHVKENGVQWSCQVWTKIILINMLAMTPVSAYCLKFRKSHGWGKSEGAVCRNSRK